MSELKSILSGRISGGDARALAGGDFKEELFQLLFDEDKRTSDNAAWVMTHLPKTADSWLAERQNTLIDEVMRTTSTTKRRLIIIGVKSLAIKLTYAQSIFYPELIEEFNTALRMMEPEVLPAALKHVRGKMLKK